ncbi:FAD-dependent oxidoreductase [Cryptosporangium aurantiacum]|uniref:Succinate dehydrogenase/fumarate reductase, flavoprotein subunit n=1 Tax=Cryptosporangium aurantiacum TaxID=134849 RepID=A0A1M7R9D2_9ACTN|nr:FAD-binding protein [Cryptosporangium aurantiacum]SHN42719.1 Succinate dehydrogenase/fumarate reductase, flavoprotein subunit [Cryptosporangium aurantiacum]
MTAATDHPVDQVTADVLVIGGGAAGTWAALAACRAGRSVVLADKAYTGTSGAAAAGGADVWDVPADWDTQESEVGHRASLGDGLADPRWLERVVEETRTRLSEWEQVSGERTLPGSAHLRWQRSRLQRRGVRILDDSPVLELLVDADGAVAGARGLTRGRGYEVRAGAVVLATGGCGYEARAVGSDVNSGDGALFAVEVGADLSGAEFTAIHPVIPEPNPVLTTGFSRWARFYRADGTPVPGTTGVRGRSVLARAASAEPVFCRLDRVDPPMRSALRLAQPAFFAPFDADGVNPFVDLFPVSVLFEGSIRSSGGVSLRGDDCATGVPGLYVAGDVAARDHVFGATPGTGAENTAWAIASGNWAGAGAADFAARLGRRHGSRTVRATGAAGLRPTGTPGTDFRDVIRTVQAEVLPYDVGHLRHGDRLSASQAELDAMWGHVRRSLGGADAVRARRAAAMLAAARWLHAAALARTESRGVHQRSDFRAADPAQARHLTVGGLDQIWTRPGEILPSVPARLPLLAAGHRA